MDWAGSGLFMLVQAALVRLGIRYKNIIQSALPDLDSVIVWFFTLRDFACGFLIVIHDPSHYSNSFDISRL